MKFGRIIMDDPDEYQAIQHQDIPGVRPTWIATNMPSEIVSSDLFVFKLKFSNGKLITVNVANDVEVDYERLEQQLDECPGQYVFWACIYSEAKEMVTLLERRIKIRRGVLVDDLQKSAKDSGLLRLTEKQVLAVVEKDDLLNQLEIKLATLQKNTGKLWHMMKAIEMKSEHLRSRSGFKKQELRQTQ